MACGWLSPFVFQSARDRMVSVMRVFGDESARSLWAGFRRGGDDRGIRAGVDWELLSTVPASQPASAHL